MLATHYAPSLHKNSTSFRGADSDIYEIDLPACLEECIDEDWRAVDQMLADAGEHDALLNHLRHLTVTSLSSYQEIADLGTNHHLKSFADVIVRQRSAQQQSLYDSIQYLSSGEEDEYPESLSALRSIWRCAIWSLEQNNEFEFLEHLEHAEAFLEEAYLAAAASLHADPMAAELRDYAVMVCGARAICEDLANEFAAENELSHGSESELGRSSQWLNGEEQS